MTLCICGDILTWFAGRYAPLDSGFVKVLDLGCGNGLSARLLNRAGYDVVGTDISALFLEEAREWENPGLGYQAADALELPFGSGEFDVVCSNDLIEHLADAEAALSEMARVVRKGGRVIVRAPNISSPITPLFDLIGLILGKPGRSVFGETKREAYRRMVFNCRLCLKKKGRKTPRFLYRSPGFQIIGGDSDSVYYSSPIDLVRFFKLNGFAIVKKCAGYETIKSKIMAAATPYISTYISMVAQKVTNVKNHRQPNP